MKIPDLQKLREYLSYDPKTGIFTWIKTKNNFRVETHFPNLRLEA